MTLYVLRHAIAEEPGPGQPDSARQLTPRGRQKARRVLSHAHRIGTSPELVLTSPYARAAQTAAIAHEELRMAEPLVETDALVPFVDVYSLWDELRAHLVGDLMIVGHNPQLSSLVSWLLGARADSLWLKKSGLVALDVGSAGPRPRAMLSWLLTPGSVGR